MNYKIKPEFLPLWGSDATADTIINDDDLEMIARGWEKDPEQLKDQLIPQEHKTMKINFEAGTSRHGNESVNFMICLDDPRLYAEIIVPDGASEDFGYFPLRAEIIRQAQENGITSPLEFWYDGQENFLAPDAEG